jgi:replication factor C small subunit
LSIISLIFDLLRGLNLNTIQEKIKVDNKVIDALHEISNGDVRRMENLLQSCAAINKKISESLIYEIASAAKPREVLEILELSVKPNFIKARDLLLNTMLKHGLSGLDIIKQIQAEIWNLKLSDTEKIKLIERCGETEFRMVEGSDEFLQLEALLANFALVKKQ